MLIKFFNLIEKIENVTKKIEKKLMIVVIFLIVTLTLLAVFNRYIVKSTLMSWYQEVNIILYTILIFWGSSNVAKGNFHMRLELFAIKLKHISIKQGIDYYNNYRIINNLFCLIISMMGVYYFSKFVILTNKVTPILRISTKYTFAFSFVGGFIGLSISYITNIFNVLKDKRTFNINIEENQKGD